MSITDDFIRRVDAKTLRISVIGLGYVGIPTAAVFAESGFSVTGYDVNAATVELVNSGRCPIEEDDLESMVKRNSDSGRLKASVFGEGAGENSDCVLICVQTPIKEDRNPDLSYVEDVLRTLCSPGMKCRAIVLVSTIPPGTTRRIAESIVSTTRLKPDEDMLLAYAPERIAPGDSIREFTNNVRLIGGIGPNSTRAISHLFKTACRDVISADVASAEVSKLAENTYRDVNIALVNELSLICEATGADISNVVRLANSHPRVSLHQPGPGVGGPCLTKDPYFLMTRCHVDDDMDVVAAARRMNDYMPIHTTRMILDALDNTGKSRNRSVVALLGMTYKAGVGDLRESPAVRVLDYLRKAGVKFRVHDPHVKADFDGCMERTLEDCVRGSDCLVLLTDHPDFRDIDLTTVKGMMNLRPILIDTRRIVNPENAIRAGFLYLGIGHRAVQRISDCG